MANYFAIIINLKIKPNIKITNNPKINTITFKSLLG